MKQSISKLRRGFTLVELLVVIAIIAILTGIIVASFTEDRAKARDSERISDLAQIQLALEQYFDRCGYYPNTLSISDSNGCPAGVNLGSYISKIPNDPLNSGSNIYTYATNYSSGSGESTDYVLHATLEYSNFSAQSQGLQTPTSGDTYYSTANSSTNNGSSFSCPNNVATSLDYCVGPK